MSETGGERRIVALWLPHWPVERLYRAWERDRQAVSRETPLALAAVAQGGLRITVRNRAAAAAGIEAGQLVPDAMALCPGLDLHMADMAADHAALERLTVWCQRFTPWAALDPVGLGLEPDGILLDITGCAHLLGGEAALLDALLSRMRGFDFTARAALASSPGAAWALARFGPRRAFILPAGGEAEALKTLPVAALRLSSDAVDGLIRLGLKHVGDLYGRPRAPIAARFGRQVAQRLDEALGLAAEPISPVLPSVPFRARLLFTEGLTQRDHVEEAIRQLADELCRLLARERKGARQLQLMLFRVDGEVIEIAAGAGAASHDARHLSRLFREKLVLAGDDFDTGFGIEAMALHCVAADPLNPVQENLGDESSHGEELAQLIDRLGNRLGHERVTRLEPRASHIPERAVAPVPAMRGPTPAMRGWRARAEETMAAALGGSLARPLRLLPAAEPVDVVAEVPEGPPRLFRWRRVAHQVVRTEGPERIAPEWWRPGDRLTRDYYRVEDVDGRRFWLFRDGLYLRDDGAPRWYLHGVFE